MPTLSAKRIAYALVALTPFLSPATAHTWVEEVDVIAPNGTFVGQPGYIRGYVPRSAPNFNDNTMVHLLPPNGRPEGTKILPTDPMCKDTQQAMTQTPNYPQLQAQPGSSIALRYQENGHVTLPATQKGKPDNRGTVYVYGTTQPKSNDTLLSIHNVWNKNGTGGDKRGVLLATQNYDDGQCYQVNGGQISIDRQAQFKHTADQLMGADLWCQTDFALPVDAPSGKPYTVYWVWDWPTLPNADPGLPNGKEEVYTSCLDIQVDAAGPTTEKKVQANTSGGYVQGQNINSAAIPSYMQGLNSGSTMAAPPAPASSAPAPSSAAPVAASSPAPSVPATAPSSASDTSCTHSMIASQAPAQAPPATVTVTVTVSASSTSIPSQPPVAASTLAPVSAFSTSTTTITPTIYVYPSSKPASSPVSQQTPSIAPSPESAPPMASVPSSPAAAPQPTTTILTTVSSTPATLPTSTAAAQASGTDAKVAPRCQNCGRKGSKLLAKSAKFRA